MLSVLFVIEKSTEEEKGKRKKKKRIIRKNKKRRRRKEKKVPRLRALAAREPWQRVMDSKGDGAAITPPRTSDRLRQRPKYLGRPFLCYKLVIRKKIKSKKRTAASQIAKKLPEQIESSDAPLRM
ncbi:hypothetical protein BHM03_00025244 [Ensete ventricosum]|nr:hypothetical protein BHM03_00025244 [Ensete ventricosum]